MKIICAKALRPEGRCCVCGPERRPGRFEEESWHRIRPDRLMSHGEHMAICPQSSGGWLLFSLKTLKGWRSYGDNWVCK